MRKIDVEVEVECDTTRLYASLDEAIKYLTEVRDAHPNQILQLDECWEDCATMRMRFFYLRCETNEELLARRKEMARKLRLKRAQDRKDKARAKKVAEYRKLQRELGL